MNPAMPARPAILARPARRHVQGTVRLVEIALIGLGIWFVLGDERRTASLDVLVAWDLAAGGYLAVGFVSAMRHRGDLQTARPPAPTSWVDRVLYSHRFNSLFVLVASAIGLAAATAVVVNRHDGKLGNAVTAAGIVAIMLAWMLLHVGYAQLYAALYFRPGPAGGGLEFPATRDPGQVEFLYFSFTMGTTFAASDVTITGRDLRWRVTMHSIISFFYNAVVLALAINILITF